MIILIIIRKLLFSLDSINIRYLCKMNISELLFKNNYQDHSKNSLKILSYRSF